MPTYKFNRALIGAVNLDSFRRFNVCHYFNDVFHKSPGEEHYKLLSYVSSLFNNVSILEIGTSVGCSAMCLASNSANNVTTYDVTDVERSNIKLDNLTYKIGNALEGDLSKYSVIFCDAAKDGELETNLLNKLDEISWKGWLIFDDYLHYPNIREICDGFNKYPKYDLTSIGHWSGTLLIDYSGESQISGDGVERIGATEENEEEKVELFKETENTPTTFLAPETPEITVVNLSKRFKFN